jgi:N utilization substance protein A
MSTGISANRMEILQIADAVAREKSIEKEIVIEAMEHALQKAARSRYGAEHDIRAIIDPKTGEMTLKRVMTVVDESMLDPETRPFNPSTDIMLDVALKTDKEAVLGKEYDELLPPIEFGRVAAQTAKQVINHEVREAERERQFGEYKDRVGEIVNGVVKRVEFYNVIVDLGRAEGVIRKSESIPRENLRVGDRTRAYIYDVRRETKGPQIFLSRAKIAVVSHDSSIDPVGACVGMRGARVQAVVGELQGEKIDIIPWASDPATFIVNALQPAEVTKVVLDPEEARVEVVVGEAQLSLAIGRRGQNVRLASQLTGGSIDILTEAEESERRQKEFAARSELFIKALEVDEMFAQLLASEGFETVEEIAYVDANDLASIEGLNDEIAEELQARAKEYLDKLSAELEAKRVELGVEDALTQVPGLTPQMVVGLGEKGVKTLEDFAGFTGDELRGWFETKGGERVREPGVLEDFQLTQEAADALILNARIAAGWIDAPAEEPEAEAAGDEGSEPSAASVFPDRT